jgi:hypothetical protein
MPLTWIRIRPRGVVFHGRWTQRCPTISVHRSNRLVLTSRPSFPRGPVLSLLPTSRHAPK